METLKSNNKGFLELKEYLDEWFAFKMTTVQLFYHGTTLAIDHNESVFVEPIEGYEKVIRDTKKYNDFTINLHKEMLSGYIERIKLGHLFMLRDSYRSIKLANIKVIEVRIKGKELFKITEEEVIEASQRPKDKFFIVERK